MAKYEELLRKNHLTAGEVSAADRERFWSHVARNGSVLSCWVWKNAGGKYARFSVNDRGFQAHRVAWLLAHGRYPGDRFVCHHCDNPSCVNPTHLFLGTPAENSADARSKGRTRRKADRSPRSRLSPEEVLRSMRSSGLTHAKLGGLFGVSAARVRRRAQAEGWG